VELSLVRIDERHLLASIRGVDVLEPTPASSGR
jgi:hypothetical protein